MLLRKAADLADEVFFFLFSFFLLFFSSFTFFSSHLPFLLIFKPQWEFQLETHLSEEELIQLYDLLLLPQQERLAFSKRTGKVMDLAREGWVLHGKVSELRSERAQRTIPIGSKTTNETERPVAVATLQLSL